MPDDRLYMRLDPVTRHDLEQLARRLNLTTASVVRLVVREAAERRGIPRYDEAESTTIPPALPTED